MLLSIGWGLLRLKGVAWYMGVDAEEVMSESR